MKRLAIAVAFVVAFYTAAAAQTLTVKRNVYLRSQPSSQSDKIAKLLPADELQLLDPNITSGFYHVETGTGEEGWVWGNFVELEQTRSQPVTTTSPEATTTEATSNAPVVTAVESQISTTWDKPAAQDAVFHGQEGLCGLTGDGGDTATNQLKNRVDVPTEYHLVNWSSINKLPYPQGAPRSRMQWASDQLAQIAPYEGEAVSAEGYLYKVKVESGGSGESTNCHFKRPTDVDWHMAFTENPGGTQGGSEADAIIVETTPRVREQHPNWTPAALEPWTYTLRSHQNPNYNGQRVRISGWLMLDPEHQDMINHGQRSTLWEIHPITKIETSDGHAWTDLDAP